MNNTQDNIIQDDNITMDQIMASMDNELEIHQGLIVEGIIVSVDKDGIMVDIGGKSEAKIPADQLTAKEAENIEENFTVGEKIKARVLQPSSKEGIILSKKAVDYELRWDDIQEIYNNKKTFTATVKEVNRGGIRVDLLGYPAFCPNSQIWGKPDIATEVIDGKEVKTYDYSNLTEKIMGTDLKFEIIELNKEKHKIIISNRSIIKREKDKERKEFWDGIFEGQTRDGVVKSITSFGAFVNLGANIDGMLHISEMSWNRIASPKSILKIGDKIQVLVTKIEKNVPEKNGKTSNRISLSLKQIQPDPWNEIPGKYPVDSVFETKILRVNDKVVFTDLGDGIEGIIPISEISLKKINVCSDVVSKDQIVKVKVKSISENERKVTLSIKALELEAQEQEEAEAYEEQQKEDIATSSINLGELLEESGIVISDTEENNEN